MRAEEAEFDALVISHEHPDHFDVHAIGCFLDNGHTEIYTNCTVVSQLRGMGADLSRVHELHKGEAVQLPECSLLPVDCDHGELAPEALGLLFDFGFTRVYYAGDTSLTLDRLQTPLARKPEIAILPINGAYGNLDSQEAAHYAGLLEAKVCIPCHFWTFALHGGDPQKLIDCIGDEAPGCKLAMLCQGECYLAGDER